MVYDKNDPVYSGLSGDRAEDMILKRHQRWLEMQPDDTKTLFCEHGRYVGYGKVFAYKCERCNPGYED